MDLSEGGYVSKEKYGELDTAKKGIEKQLKDANATINSYKEMDIDGIKNRQKTGRRSTMRTRRN